MTACCNACGQEWPRDPALEVECPDCRAGIGSACRRPSGHACAVHGGRDRLAMDRGFLEPCPARLTQEAAEHPTLFAHLPAACAAGKVRPHG